MDAVLTENIPNLNGFKYSCSMCSFKINHKPAFIRHVNSHKDRDKHGQLDYSYLSRGEFSDFIEEWPLPKGKYSCSRCDFTTNVASAFSNHHCPQFKPLKAFPNDSLRRRALSFRDHVLAKKVSLADPAKPPGSLSADSKIHSDKKAVLLFKCLKCSFEAKSKGALKLHSLVHGQHALCCSRCDYITHFQTLLELHESSHSVKSATSSSQLQCPQCPYMSTRMCSLQRHLLKHSKVKMLECLKCSFKTSSEDLYKEHKAFHISIRPQTMNCPSCDFSALSIVGFEEHLTTHNHLDEKVQAYLSSRKYRCPDCPYGTDTKENLIRHCVKHPKQEESLAWGVIDQRSSSTGKSQGRKKGKKGTLAPLPKKKSVSTGKRVYITWPNEDKKEMFWCYTLARISNSRLQVLKRMMQLLFQRGIVNPEKLKGIPPSRFYTMVNNIKTGRTPVQMKELREIEDDVKRYVRENGFPAEWKSSSWKGEEERQQEQQQQPSKSRGKKRKRKAPSSA